MMQSAKMIWRGKPLNEYSRLELIEIIETLGRMGQEINSPENIEARALGRVEMLTRQERRNA
jgi:hypothetical protein